MPFQINPSKVPIWQNEQSLKLGLSETDQVLDAVTNAQERLIQLLFQGIPEDQIGVVGQTAGLEKAEISELIDRLRPSLLDTSKTPNKADSFDSRFAEIIRIGFESNSTSESVLSNRAKSVILIPNLDRTGLTLTKSLAEAGFREFVTTDYGVVTRADLGELGYRNQQVGFARLTAAREEMANHCSTATINHIAKTDRKKPRLKLLSGMYRINPNDYRNEPLPHLGIEYDLAELRISGVIAQKVTACLGCRELWAAETDSTRASTSIQLVARQDHLDDGASLLLATSIAAKTVSRFVDSQGTERSSGYRVDLRTRSIAQMSWQPHPLCQCKKL